MPPRTPIDAALVHSLIRAQFPHWADLPIAPVTQGGWDNRTFRLGPTLLARLPSARRYAAQVAKEQRWLPRLAPHLPLPVPEPVALGQPGPGFPRPWSVYRWIEGEPATSANVPNLPGFATILAQFLATCTPSRPSGPRCPAATTSGAAARSPLTTPKPARPSPPSARRSTPTPPWLCGQPPCKATGARLRSGCMATLPPATCCVSTAASPP